MLVLVVGGIVVAAIVAAWYGQGGGRRLSGTRPRPRRVLKGTESRAPRASGSSRSARATERDHSNGGEGPADEQSSSRPPDKTPPSPAAQAVEEALSALSPTQAIENLHARLAELQNLGEAAQLYCALGTLHSQTDPPDAFKAEGAFAIAERLAQSLEDKHRVAYLQATMLAQQGEHDKARDKALAALKQDEPATLSRLRLRVLLGTLYEGKGEVVQAESAYEKAMKNSLSAFNALGPQALDVYRQSCLCLARVYRKTGRDSQADGLARRLKNNLSLLQEP